LCACCTKQFHHDAIQNYVLQTEFVAHNNLTQNLRIEAAPATNFSDTKTASVFIGLSSAFPNFLHTILHHDEIIPLVSRRPAGEALRTATTQALLIHRFCIAYPSLLQRVWLAIHGYLAICAQHRTGSTSPGPAD
jgi:hypothetical protein